MSSSKGETPDIEVPDPEAAMRNLVSLGRRILAVPKQDVDAKAKTAKKPRHGTKK